MIDWFMLVMLGLVIILPLSYSVKDGFSLSTVILSAIMVLGLMIWVGVLPDFALVIVVALIAVQLFGVRQ